MTRVVKALPQLGFMPLMLSQRYKDAGTTQIIIDLGGNEAKVFFPNKLQPTGPAITERATFGVAACRAVYARCVGLRGSCGN